MAQADERFIPTRVKLGLSIRYRPGLAEDLGERYRYDVVFAADVLEHVEDL